MGKAIQQICVNKETGKSIYLIDYNDGVLTYRVSTEPSHLQSDTVEYEDNNVVIGTYFFHRFFLDNFIEINK